ATATARASLDSLDEEISAQSALVSQHDLEQGRLAGAVRAAEERLGALRAQLERQRTALAAADERRESARAELIALEGDDEGAAEDTELAAAVAAAEQAVTALQERVDSLREELHTAERERDALAARTSALTMATDQQDGSQQIIGLGGIRGL